MTSTEIQDQITIIREVAEDATISKEHALQFLADAGILELIDEPTEAENPNR
jgi:acetyl-CoA carboxylase beta subunit